MATSERLMNCAPCGYAWMVRAEKPGGPMSCPSCSAHVCGCGCGEHLGGMRSDAVFWAPSHREDLRRALGAGDRGSRLAIARVAHTQASVHPLQEVRDARATKKHNRDLGGLIKQAIIDRIKTTGECHADDLVELYPEGEVALCRRLATAQFGSMAKLELIRKDGWRRTEAASRKGGGGWIWKFTDKGRAQFMGSLVGLSDNDKGGGGAVDNARPAPGNAGLPSGAPVGVAESGESNGVGSPADTGQVSGKRDQGRPIRPSSSAGVGSSSSEPETLFGESAYERLSDAA